MRALITGITGQDGSYLAELLLEKGHDVYGMLRSNNRGKSERIEQLRPRITFIAGDLEDQGSLDRAIGELQPDEIYNLAAQSFVPVSWTKPISTADVTGMGVLRLLESVRKHSPRSRFLQVSSSEMFGETREKPQNERTLFCPRNPYGAAKTFGHHITASYREGFGIFACSAICFNHESPRRGPEFLTRKVSRQVAKIKLGLCDRLLIGNLDAERDWGFAGDFVRAMWLMLQQEKAEDYVIATGETHSVKEVLEVAFSYVGLDWREYIEIDPNIVRPAEANNLVGDYTKAKTVLKWEPQVSFRELIEMMVEADLKSVEKSLQMRSSPGDCSR